MQYFTKNTQFHWKKNDNNNNNKRKTTDENISKKKKIAEILPLIAI